MTTFCDCFTHLATLIIFGLYFSILLSRTFIVLPVPTISLQNMKKKKSEKQRKAEKRKSGQWLSSSTLQFCGNDVLFPVYCKPYPKKVITELTLSKCFLLRNDQLKDCPLSLENSCVSSTWDATWDWRWLYWALHGCRDQTFHITLKTTACQHLSMSGVNLPYLLFYWPSTNGCSPELLYPTWSERDQ